MVIREQIVKPPRLHGSEKEQFDQLRMYLFSLTDQLQNIFDSIGTDNNPAGGYSVAAETRRDNT